VRAQGAPRRATARASRPFILRGSLTLAPQDDGFTDFMLAKVTRLDIALEWLRREMAKANELTQVAAE